MANTKYYKIMRNNSHLAAEYLCELRKEDRMKFGKKINPSFPFLLIEKTIIKDEVGTSEHYTGVWTIQEGVNSLWEKYTKGRVMYDYTGLVYPLIHKDGKVQTWKQYSETII